ncbi:hypothetical protein MOBT1_000283 [Malassezia obtusa]|uniref:Cation/H+ exchanger transmembrane domain-containing protein n=1 Tax=Malassezia obtusa TaxID=76774 RepID=A0AAF0IQP4_9BASI|nr:hypothetical protein MOBT1_000283 [Malassezia obtusa]
MGVNVLLGSDDLLAAFACGSAFAWDGWFQKQTEDSNFSSIIDLLFNIATFVYIGAIMPWHDFVNAEINIQIWRLIVLAILILLLKRIPIVVAMWKFIPDIKTFHEAIFSGYFGPMGVGAIFMSTYGRLLLIQHVEYPPKTTNDVLAYTIQPVVFFLVLASVIVHGFTLDELDEAGTKEVEEVGRIGQDEDWGGEDTLEMRKYRQKKAFERRASLQHHDEKHEKDIADAGDEHHDANFPQVKEWVEGNSMVLEYQDHALSDTKTVVIPITEEDRKHVKEKQSPFYAWLARHGEKLEHSIGWQSEDPMHQSHIAHLFNKGVPSRLSRLMHEWTEAKMTRDPEYEDLRHTPGKAPSVHGAGEEEHDQQPTTTTHEETTENPGSIITLAPPNTWNSTPSAAQDSSSLGTVPQESQSNGILRTEDPYSTEERYNVDSASQQTGMSESNGRHVSFAAYRPPGVTKNETVPEESVDPLDRGEKEHQD